MLISCISFNYKKLDPERENIIPVLNRRAKVGIKRVKRTSETHSTQKVHCSDLVPEQRFPTSDFECLHTYRENILFLTDMMPNLRFNGYNREKLFQDI